MPLFFRRIENSARERNHPKRKITKIGQSFKGNRLLLQPWEEETESYNLKTFKL